MNETAQLKNIRFDRDLSISTAPKHHSLKWKNQTITWSEFLERIQKTERTSETVKEYNAMSKADKNDKKDVGGFVGGFLKQNRRKSGNVMNRSMVTLDIDYADDGVLETIRMLVDYSYAIYSTHSHREHAQRYRLIIPLSRNVTSEEYEPLARKLADAIGMDYFDDTSYEVARLMYWPSTSIDGRYVFEYEDNGFVDPDKVLSEYLVDWRDPLEWPTSSREGEKVVKLAKQQGDPHEKPGLVGAFCRTYSIHEVIETFLSDVYVAHDENRYTLIDGSTAGGLVVYQDGKFAYSHHGTDVISNTLVNSFDLLRLHKYGAQDIDKRHDIKVTNLPSYKAMIQFIENDPKISKQLVKERMQEVDDEFGVIEDEDTDIESTENNEDDDSWMGRITFTKQGAIENTIPNIVLIMSNDPRIKGKLRFNAFSNRAMRHGKTPWNDNPRHEYWTDDDDSGLRNYLESTYEIHNRSKTDDAIRVVMSRDKYHPVRDYLDGLEWDGIERLDRLFVKYLGAEDTELNRTATRIAFTAAVARVYEPGVKFDYMLTLYGAQGVGKSMIFNKMGRQWFSDSLVTVNGKEAFEALQGAWIVEMGELSATRKADIESIKHFISKREDRFRVAYGRHVEDFPRQCVFFGTTNDATFLKDRTGNRRFWPITVDASRVETRWSEMKDEDINHLWAEAKFRYESGQMLFLPAKLEDEMNQAQEAHTEDSPYYGVIQDYLEKKIPVDWYEKDIYDRRAFLDEGIAALDPIDETELMEREKVCALEIWTECLGNDLRKFPMIERREINDVLRNMKGWKTYDGNKDSRMRFGKSYGIQRGYVKENFIDSDII